MKELLIIGGGLLLVPTVKVAKSMGLKGVRGRPESRGTSRCVRGRSVEGNCTYNPSGHFQAYIREGW